ncbi:Lrp/AsnC ligand binding domain-containing protein [Clostridioides difficile]|nr:Lrp/AsnC ligand binding domain-containing protein [Clostridioides difficile]
MSGEYDYLIKVLAEDTSNLEEFYISDFEGNWGDSKS